ETAAAAPLEPIITSPISGLPVVDPILLDVLRTEVGQHLDGMRAYLARDAAFDAAVDDELVRSVHTLHGAIAMVGVDSLATMLAPLEVWIRRVRSADAALDREGCDALRDAIALTEHVMAQFDAPVPDVPDTTALTERLEALRNRWPEASPLGSARHAVESRAPAAAQFEEAAEDSGVAAVGLESASTLPTEDDATALAAREAAEHAEQERVAAEQAEQERLAAERAEQERAAAEQAEQARLAAEQAERERIAAEQAEQQRLAEQVEHERLAAEQAEQERIAAEQAERERAAAEQAEQERVAAEQAERERVAAEQAEQERIAAEQAEQERIAAEQAEQERIAAEKAERD